MTATMSPTCSSGLRAEGVEATPSRGMSASAGMAATSWKSRMAKALRPCEVPSSFFSPSSCVAKAVEDMARPTPIATPAAGLSPRATATPPITSAERPTCALPRPNTALRIFQSRLGLELEADHEEQQHHAELREVQRLVHLAHEPEARRPDEGARGEVAEHRPEAQPAEERDRDDGGREEDRRGGEHGGAHRLSEVGTERPPEALQRPSPSTTLAVGWPSTTTTSID